MRLCTIVTALFMLLFHCCYSQTKSKPLILDTIDKGDYFYIPKYLMADSVAGILCQEKTFEKTNPSKRTLTMYWVSTCEDGYYNLTITPEQIFFSSSHENPNPNQIFWVVSINATQYEAIIYGLKHKCPDGFEDLSKVYNQSKYVLIDNKFKDNFAIPDNWTKDILKKHEVFCELQRRKQLTRYFSVINNCIADKNTKVIFPVIENLENRKPKYFTSSNEELKDWIGITR